MFKISFTASPMNPLMASDAGIHILGQDIKQTKLKVTFASLPDGMQSFRRCTFLICAVGDKISDSSQAERITRFESRVLVNNKTFIILWTKREVNVGPSP